MRLVGSQAGPNNNFLNSLSGMMLKRGRRRKLDKKLKVAVITNKTGVVTDIQTI